MQVSTRSAAETTPAARTNNSIMPGRTMLFTRISGDEQQRTRGGVRDKERRQSRQIPQCNLNIHLVLLSKVWRARQHSWTRSMS